MRSTKRNGAVLRHEVRDRVTKIAKELMQTGTVHDPARTRLVETRLALINAWKKIPDTLDLQGEIQLAGDVRYFARRLPPVRTDDQAVAEQFAQHLRSQQVRHERTR